MHERRQERRFNLRLPGLITVPGNNLQNDFHQADSINVSSGGAYLKASRPIAIGTRIGIDLLVRLNAEADHRRQGSCISLKGEVVRSDPGGVAVKFDGFYQISSIAKLLADSRTRIQWLEIAADEVRTTAGTGPATGKTSAVPHPKRLCRIGAAAASAIRSLSGQCELNHQ